MCIAVAGKIREVKGDEAKVNVMGVEIMVNIQLIDNPQVGNHVLIHAGCAIQKIDEAYFDELNTIFNGLLEKEGR